MLPVVYGELEGEDMKDFFASGVLDTLPDLVSQRTMAKLRQCARPPALQPHTGAQACSYTTPAFRCKAEVFSYGAKAHASLLSVWRRYARLMILL